MGTRVGNLRMPKMSGGDHVVCVFFGVVDLKDETSFQETRD